MPSLRALNLPIARPVLLAVTSATTAAAMALYVTSPQLSPIILAGCLLIAAIWWRIDGTAIARVSLRTAAVLAALVGWFALTMIWSVDRGSAAFATFLFAAGSLVALGTFALLDGLNDDVVCSIAIAFACGIGFGIWLSFEENVSGMFLRRLINSIVPLTRPHSVHLRTETGLILEMMPYMSNKNTAAALVMTWPFALISKSLALTPTHRWLRWLTLAAAVVGALLSSHETSKLAIFISGLIFAIAIWRRAVAFALVGIGWIFATLLVVPASHWAYSSGAHTIEAIQYSGRHRLVIWGVTADRTMQKPMLGQGLASTRVLDEMAPPEQRGFVPGTNIPDGTNMHSHNVFVQAWYETGMIGGVLLFLAGLPALAWLQTRRDESAPYLLAAFTAAVTMASLSWSLVASWYIATFGLIAVWCGFADIVSRRIPASDTSVLAAGRHSHSPLSQ